MHWTAKQIDGWGCMATAVPGVACVLVAILVANCSPTFPPTVPMQWTTELTADQVEHIRGAADGAGPFVAGSELWERAQGGWHTVQGAGSGWREVWPRSADDVWAVGEGGKTMHRGTVGWRLERFPDGATGVAVMAWEGVAWSSVTYGEINRHTGSGWSSWTPRELAARHSGVLWGASSNDVWMHTHKRTTGVPPDLGHWNGTTWTFHALWKNGYIANIAGSASDDVWAVGWTVKLIGKGPLAAHWNGRRWSDVVLPTTSRLCDVFVEPSGVVWIAGFDGTLLRGREGAFVRLEAPETTINGVYANARGDVWILVEGRRVLRATKQLAD